MPDDENNNTDATAATNATTATDPVVETSPVFTQAQVNAIVQQRLAEQERRRAKAEPVAAPKAETKSEKRSDVADEVAALRAQLENVTLRNRFDKPALRLGLADEAADTLFKIFQLEQPEDASAWLDVTAKKLGMKAPTAITATQTQPVTAPVEARPAPAAPNAPAKVDPITEGGLVNIMRLSENEITQLGPSGMRAHFEKAVAVGNQHSGMPSRPKIANRK